MTDCAVVWGSLAIALTSDRVYKCAFIVKFEVGLHTLKEMEPFGRQLANALERSGMSQSEFARKVGVTQAFVSQIIHGHTAAPDAGINGWAKVLMLPPEDHSAFELAAGMTRTPKIVKEYISKLEQQLGI